MLLLSTAFTLCMTFALPAQEPLTNEGVIKLVKSGMSEELILSVLQQQPGAYSFGADDLIALKQASVSERIIAAMLARGKSGAAAGALAGAPKTAASTSISGPGLYYKKGNDSFEL